MVALFGTSNANAHPCQMPAFSPCLLECAACCDVVRSAPWHSHEYLTQAIDSPGQEPPRQSGHSAARNRPDMLYLTAALRSRSGSPCAVAVCTMVSGVGNTDGSFILQAEPGQAATDEHVRGRTGHGRQLRAVEHFRKGLAARRDAVRVHPHFVFLRAGGKRSTVWGAEAYRVTLVTTGWMRPRGR